VYIEAKLDASLEALVPYLSRRTAHHLPADRRISLATLFMQTRRVGLAREQLQACFETLDTESLCALTPAAAVNLLALSRALEVPFPSEDLRTLALQLIPPRVRARLNPAP
jgi:hypothetical protein